MTYSEVAAAELLGAGMSYRAWDSLDDDASMRKMAGLWADLMDGRRLREPHRMGDSRRVLVLEDFQSHKVAVSILVQILSDPDVGTRRNVRDDTGPRLQFDTFAPSRIVWQSSVEDWTERGRDSDHPDHGDFRTPFHSYVGDGTPMFALFTQVDSISWTEWAVKKMINLLQSRTDQSLITILCADENRELWMPDRIADLLEEVEIR